MRKRFTTNKYFYFLGDKRKLFSRLTGITIVLFAYIAGAFAQGNFVVEEFNSSGSYTIPASVTKITVEAWGGGGGGGGSSSNKQGGSGGGGGGYTSQELTVAPGDVISFTVGGGGAAGVANGGTGGNGGVTTISSLSMVAEGGTGGGGNRGTAGTGGSATGGATNDNGVNGSTGTTSGGAGGKGGGEAGGAGGAGGNTNSVGNPGAQPGGGGGGGEYGNGNNLRAGGLGGNGLVRISYFISETEFTSSGTFRVPEGVTEITVEAWGGGGGGGTRNNNGVGGGGGGGGGAYAKKVLPVNPNDIYDFIVGTGGAAGTAGGLSYLRKSETSIDLVKAAGGSGVANNTTNGGAGGSATGTNSIGDIRRAGGNGGTATGSYSGGGGGGAGSGSAGVAASGQTGGSATFEFGGAGPNGITSNGNGTNGSNYGGGGSGAYRQGGGGTRTGGSGAPGFIRITYVPNYRAELSDAQTGLSIWEVGKPRTVSIKIKNTGKATWTAGEVVLKVKWNDGTFFTTDPNGLASNSEETFNFNVTAPSILTEENLTFTVEHNGVALAEFKTGDLQIVPSIIKYYSYKTGNWDDPKTWTHDPSGTTQVCQTIPDDYSEVVILSGRTVSLSDDVDASALNISIAAGGILDLTSFKFSSELAFLKGQGTLRLASPNFPSVTADGNTFVEAGGGTTEYYNSSSFTLPTGQETYNNLSILTGSAVATQMSDLWLNGDLHVKSGTYRINDDEGTSIHSLTVSGDVTVNSGASITVGTGETNTTDTSTGITGGTAPFLNYYTNFHTVIIKGNFTNDGTVRFTNLDYPIFNAFPSATGKTGAATVYFQGATNNTLTCNGTTDFYNLVLDKGLDQTYKLTVYSSAYQNFRLFGANNSGGDLENATGANPNLKKALWIRTGTLELTGLTVIPSLSEGSDDGTNPNSDFFIPVNGALVLNGPDVIVLGTADNYSEVNAAYGVSGGTGNSNGVNIGQYASSFSVYGRFQVKDGYFSTRECGGIITWDQASGQVEIFGGFVDIKQMRAASGAGMSGLASYNQTGGTLALRGRFQRQPAKYETAADLKATAVSTINTTHSTTGLDGSKGIFNIDVPANVFMMSGGSIQVYDVNDGTGGAIEINSSPNNINVTGGTIKLTPIRGGNLFLVRSTAPFGNLLVDRADGSSLVRLGTHSLAVLKDVNITAGVFEANSLDVTVGGNFTLGASGTYNSGTNTTLFNGAGNQIFTNNGTINNGSAGLNNLGINKSGGYLRLAGDNPFTVRSELNLTKGVLDDGGKILTVLGNITNSGIHQGTGAIKLQGTALQTVGGDGNGVFNNVTLSNTNAAAAPVSLTANMLINGVLNFEADKQLDIYTYNLKMGASASFSTNIGGNRFIRSAGNAGDGGVTLTYDSPADRTFPVGINSYCPAILGFSSAPSSYGSITVVPVNYKHPVTANDNALKYFWRVKSSGFEGYSGKVSHAFTVSNDIPGGGNANNYRPAVYTPIDYTWSYGETTDIDIPSRTINDWTTPSQSNQFLDGDYTAGEQSAFAEPAKFYSRQTGNWNTRSTWSTAGHDGNSATRIPVDGDIVIIGNGHTVSLERDNNSANRDNQNCASLQIESGGILDVSYNPASNFGMVLSHPGGNGLLRVSTQYNSGGTFEFPKGDFSEFNAQLGTTELYTINPTAGGTYWLPNDIDNYGNLILSPLGGSNIIFGNTDVTIYGNLVTMGQNSESWFCPTWDGDYPTNPSAQTAKEITIQGNFDIQGGALIFHGNKNIAQDFVVHGDLIISEGAGIHDVDVTDWWGRVISSSTNQSIKVGGDLVNNAAFGNGINEYSGCDFSHTPLTFFGGKSASITNKEGTPSTIFSTVTINKGTSQAPKLTIDIAGTLNTPADDWLTFENGTLEYKRTNPSSDFTISTTTPLTIPASAGLWVDYTTSDDRNVLIANSSSDNNDLFLNGKLTVVNGNVHVGPVSSPNNNNDIEYAGGGASSIEVRGGKLVVNGQIRRNPATSSGILSYVQSGGEVVINGQNSNTTNAKLEVLNTGSKFNMSGGTLTIVRGGGGNAYGDLFLRPANSSVTGGTILFEHNLSGNPQSYLLDANVPLNNLTVTGGTANAEVKLLVSPLTLKGNLTLSNANSIFDANSEFNIPLTIKGNFDNNGTYNHHSNLTTFSGGVQQLTGTSSTSFYDLKVNPVTSLTIEKDVAVERDLELASGTFKVAGNSIVVSRNLINNATYESNTDAGGIILTGGVAEHQISGTGTFDRLELSSTHGARILNEITMRGNLILTAGILNINQYLLTLLENAEIEGTNFGASKMISSDGVYSNIGIRKLFPIISSQRNFIYPMGIAGKYTPAKLIIDSNGNAGYVRVNTVNSRHPSAQDSYRVLDYYWDVESTGIYGFNGALELHYDDDDVMQEASDETGYIAARLLTPGITWEKATPGSDTDNVDEANNTISFTFTGGTDNLNGEYTAGLDSDIPDEVPTYVTNKAGDWSDPTIWSPQSPAGGPNGVVVIINHEVTLDKNYCFAYRTTINSKLKVERDSYGHNLGTIQGNGTLYLENSLMPAGRYNSFLDCDGDATLEYGGSGDYNIVADLFTSLPNLKVSGTGSRILPNKELTICKRLIIDGATLDNGVNNKSLIIRGTMERLNNGVFNAGTGAQATVRFAGSVRQTLGSSLDGFVGTSAFNNLEIDNAQGLIMAGTTEVSGKLLLTRGVIFTSEEAPLVITNSAPTNSVSPWGGQPSSYVDGPMVKRINQGDSFLFPIGKDGVLGNKLQLSASQGGTIDWRAEYFTPNSTYASYALPLTYVNSIDRWQLSAPSGSQAKVSITWDASSDVTPLVTVNGVSDLKVASYNTATSKWNEVVSDAVGNNNNGTITTANHLVIPSSENVEVTSATVNTVKPKAKMTPSGAICGTSVGIPVTFTTSESITFNYVLNYTINGVAQTQVIVSSLPFELPTPEVGDYQLTGFTYNNGVATGVVDEGIVTVNAMPTEANAGADQSLCGATSTVLEGNTAAIGEGVWSIVSGTGGTIVNPTVPNSTFTGTNGSAYTLRWTISNGECESSDGVKIVFPLLAAQPGEFTAWDMEVCGGTQDVTYTVPNDPTVTYTWSYSGSGVAISGTGSSVNLTFANDATDGTLSVTATNACNTSEARTLDIVVNPVSFVSLTADAEEVCASSLVTFTATTEAGIWINYEFFLDDAPVQSGANNTYAASGLGAGQAVRVVATNDKNCPVTSNEVTITVISTPGLWTGSKNSDWEEGGNWCSGSVPSGGIITIGVSANNHYPVIPETSSYSISDLTINSGAELTLSPGAKLEVTSSLVNQGEFILQSTLDHLSSLMVPVNNSESGKAQIELSGLPAGQWMRLGHPIKNPTASIYDLTDKTNNYVYVMEYQWTRLLDPDRIINEMHGILARYELGHNLKYEGELNSGAVNFDFSFNSGYVLIGNPYPSAIDWQNDDENGWSRSSNISATIWHRIYLGGQVQDFEFAYNRFGGVPQVIPEEFGFTEDNVSHIAPLQSVWIKVLDNNPVSIGVDNKSRVTNSLPLKGASISNRGRHDLIRILTSRSNLYDGSVIYFNSAFSIGNDASDSPKKFNSSKYLPEIYTRIGNTAMAINGFPELTDEEYSFPISVRNQVEGEVTLSVDLDKFDNSYSVFLEDKTTGVWANLRENTDYVYTPAKMGDTHDRFVLHLKNVTTSVVTPGEGGALAGNGINITAYRNLAKITIAPEILQQSNGRAIIEVADVNGRIMDNTTTVQTITEVVLPRSNGVYLVRVKAGSVVKSEKVVVQKQ